MSMVKTLTLDRDGKHGAVTGGLITHAVMSSGRTACGRRLRSKRYPVVRNVDCVVCQTRIRRAPKAEIQFKPGYEEIAEATQEYLDNGGKIKRIEHPSRYAEQVWEAIPSGRPHNSSRGDA